MAKVGRPSKYDVKFCQQLIDHMAQGYSFESFAGLCEVDRDTLYQWLKTNEEFSDAKKIGFEMNRRFWEKVGIDQAVEGKGNSTAYIFNMKNRFPSEWRDKQDLTLAGDPENPLVTKIVREIVRPNN